jgi:hypothetical protein
MFLQIPSSVTGHLRQRLSHVAIRAGVPDTRIWEVLGLHRSRITGYSH